jgi:hypothetical protein
MIWCTTAASRALGIDYETAEFAGESIMRWWKSVDSKLYPRSRELLIVVDGGGSNGARNRLWKQQVQQLATETGLSIAVCHLPPATSKWNKIEHWLFSYISINWRGKPLTSLETIIELISHTTTEEGLTVTAVKDTDNYPTGLKVSDAEMAALKITSHSFHRDWNYTIQPQWVVLLFRQRSLAPIVAGTIRSVIGVAIQGAIEGRAPSWQEYRDDAEIDALFGLLALGAHELRNEVVKGSGRVGK